MKIVISESQYKKLTEGVGDLRMVEVEKFMATYFESLERYQETIKKFIRVLSYNKIKDVTFKWDPRLRTNKFKSFAHRTYFSVDKNTFCFQFSFTFDVMNEKYNGTFNGFMTNYSGMNIAPSINLTPLAFDYNYSNIANYIREYFKQREFK